MVAKKKKRVQKGIPRPRVMVRSSDRKRCWLYRVAGTSCGGVTQDEWNDAPPIVLEARLAFNNPERVIEHSSGQSRMCAMTFAEVEALADFLEKMSLRRRHGWSQKDARWGKRTLRTVTFLRDQLEQVQREVVNPKTRRTEHWARTTERIKVHREAARKLREEGSDC